MSFVSTLVTNACNSLKRRVRNPLGASRVNAAQRGFTTDAVNLSKQVRGKLTGRAGEPAKTLNAKALEKAFARAGVDPDMVGWNMESANTLIAWVRTLKPAERAPLMTALQTTLDWRTKRGSYPKNVEAVLKELRQLHGFQGAASSEMAANRLEVWTRQTQAASRVGGSEAYKALKRQLEDQGARLIRSKDTAGLERFFEVLGDDQPAHLAKIWVGVYTGSPTPLSQIRPISFSLIDDAMAFQPREQFERLLRYVATLK